MSRGTPRAKQARSKETVDRILASALVIYAEKGRKAVTHRAVAEHAGVSLSSTTRFFKTKEDLLADSYRWGVTEARTRYSELANSVSVAKPGDLVKYCRNILGSDLTEHAASNLAWYHFLIESTRDRNIRPISVKSFDDMFTFWCDLMNRINIESTEATNALLDYLIGEYYLVLITPGSQTDEVARAQRRVRSVALTLQT